MVLKSSLFITIFVALLSGCASTSRIPSINDNEAFKYEEKYLSEYENIKRPYHGEPKIQWMQPINKKNPCKVYSGVSIDQLQSLDENYQIFWDGSCKNGYANGLGREFVRGTVLNMESLAIYKGKQEKPQYYIESFHLDGKTVEGDLNSRLYVERTISEENFTFDIIYKYGYFGTSEKPALLTHSSPFNENITYGKHYPHFTYVLIDMTGNEFEKRKYQFNLMYKGKTNGFGFSTPKVGSTASGEYINGKIIRRVKLPNSYFHKVESIQSEAKEAGQKAINAQKYALKVKKQYMSRICKNTVSVNFIDNEEYKKICNEREYYAGLKKKIDMKFAEINQFKQQKRDKLNQQKLINSQVSQANSAARIASAAEQANITQSWQNINNNLQMQQLNNNLMLMRMGY